MFRRGKLFLFLLIFLLGLFFVPKNQALAYSGISDTITTSRPSASAPLNTDQAVGDTQIQAVDISGSSTSLFLASDSAILMADTGQAQSVATVASMSAQQSGSPNFRYVYFTSTPNPNNAHHRGTAIIVPVTATHIVAFTPSVAAIPSGGKIIITFPGSGSNIASPSATSFSFNGMTTTTPSDVVCYPATACAGAKTVTGSNTITLTTTAAQNVGTQVFVGIGCTAINSSGVCTAAAPRLINPTKTASSGTADNWKIQIQTLDAAGVTILESGKTVIATIESVQVQATVEPYITFTIAGVSNGASACGDTTNPGAGNNSTATFVNLGVLTTAINLSAQTLVVSTNSTSGYVLTSTSSGRFINPSTGVFLRDANGGNGLAGNDSVNGTNPSPASITAATTAFGVHPCYSSGSGTTPAIPTGWGSGGGAGNKYANPWNASGTAYYATLATQSSPANNSTTTVEYAATAALSVLAGTYSTIFTYVATPTF